MKQSGLERGGELGRRGEVADAPLPAFRWDGSPGHVVGPFERYQVALYFVEYVATPQLGKERIFELEGHWFIDAQFSEEGL